jgi:hypothetical protein
VRRNILEWACAEVERPDHAIWLTHNIDFLFVQSLVTPRLKQVGNPRLTILADSVCSGSSYAQTWRFLSGLGSHYRVVPMELGAGRRFHPKALILASGEKAVLAVGSGNLTHGGMGANHEVWSFFSTEVVEDRPAFAAFGDYLEVLSLSLKLDDSICEALRAPFKDGDWAKSLPKPAFLSGTPSDKALLDQLVDQVQPNIKRISVITPYFDTEGAALKELGRRFQVPVTAYVQDNHVGLHQGAADTFGSELNVGSIRFRGEDQKASFIHAKLIVFHNDSGAFAVVGSANCSRAALLADASWGNAELVAHRLVSQVDVEELLGDFELAASPPSLPVEPPQDEWEVVAPPLRILDARRQDDRLRIRFSSSLELAGVRVISEVDEVLGDISIPSGVINLYCTSSIFSIRLMGETPDAKIVESSPHWVDDEAALQIKAPVRRLLGAMAAASRSPTSTNAYLGVLQIFDEYLRDPKATLARTTDGNKKAALAGEYDPENVFSDNFGAPASWASQGWRGEQSSGSLLELILRWFPYKDETPPALKPSLQGGLDVRTDDGTHSADEPSISIEERERRKRELKRVLDRIEKSILDKAFIDARDPDQLGVDIGMAGLLLIEGHIHEHINLADFRSMTRRLWAQALGTPSKPGLILQRIDALDSDAATSFREQMASPRLTAVLSLWCTVEWQSTDADANWFKFSVASLLSEHVWLVSAFTPEAVISEIEGATLIIGHRNLQGLGTASWTGLVRAAESMRQIKSCLRTHTAIELAKMSERTVVDAGELLWQAGDFAVAQSSCKRLRASKATVERLGTGQVLRFYGDLLVPIADILKSDIVSIPEKSRREMLALIVDMTMTQGTDA